MSATRKCPALLISAVASNQGKTTITAALAYHHRRCGRRVKVFKVGPDFLDPKILERASGAPVHQLDLWMVGEEQCRNLLFEAAGAYDLILVEGVMGLYDGTPSSADLAALFGIPTVVVINAAAMAQTFNAVAFGLTTYRTDIKFAGVLANGLASLRHAEMLGQGNPGTHFLGSIMRDQELSLPERHLGLVQAEEIEDLESRLAALSLLIEKTELPSLMPVVEFSQGSQPTIPGLLAGKTIAVARDACFSFLYAANLELLEKMGANLVYFSPLRDKELPAADALYLPGGYPELHLEQLSKNVAIKEAITKHHASGRAIYAECGGMLYLLDSLEDKAGSRAPMLGLIPGKAVMQSRLFRLGYQQASFTKGNMRGHTFHYSKTDCHLVPTMHARHPNTNNEGEPIYCARSLHASYLHWYFPSNPEVTAELFAGDAVASS